MSILPNQTNKNEGSFFFATQGGGGGGSAPILFEGNENGMIITTLETTDLTTLVLSEPLVSVAGKFLLSATFNINGKGQNNLLNCYIRDGPTGYNSEVILTTTDYPHEWVSGATSLVFPYNPALEPDPPAFYFEVQQSAVDGTPDVYLTYSVVFYPTPT